MNNFKMLAKCLTCGLMVVFFAACGDFGKEITLSGTQTERRVAIDEFNQISVFSGIRVVLSNEVSEAVITTDANLQDYVKVEVVDGTLSINYDKLVRWRGDCHTSVCLPMPKQLSEVTLGNTATLEAQGTMKGEHIKIALTGSSSIKAQIECANAEVMAHSVSLAELAGTLSHLVVNIQGNSEVISSKNEGHYALMADDVEGYIGGVSKLCVHSDSSISCNISGSSSLYYTGRADTSKCYIDAVSHIYHE